MTALTPEAFGELWERLDEEAQTNKFSQQALLRLSEVYRGLHRDDRAVADGVLTRWVLEGDPVQRFDALTLIDEYAIRGALPNVRTALERLASATGPSVPTDRAKLRRVLTRLESPGETQG